MIFKEEKHQKAFDNILNTFGGDDGGVSFIRFRLFLEMLEKDDSDSAEDLLLIFLRFSKMIDVANERY